MVRIGVIEVDKNNEKNLTTEAKLKNTKQVSKIKNMVGTFRNFTTYKKYSSYRNSKVAALFLVLIFAIMFILLLIGILPINFVLLVNSLIPLVIIFITFGGRNQRQIEQSNVVLLNKYIKQTNGNFSGIKVFSVTDYPVQNDERNWILFDIFPANILFSKLSFEDFETMLLETTRAISSLNEQLSVRNEPKLNVAIPLSKKLINDKMPLAKVDFNYSMPGKMYFISYGLFLPKFLKSEKNSELQMYTII